VSDRVPSEDYLGAEGIAIAVVGGLILWALVILPVAWWIGWL